MARAISDNPQLIKDKPVLGTGAGSRLLGLSALFGFAFNIDVRKAAVFTPKAIRINLKANKQDRVETPINFDEQNISEATVWQIVPYHRLHYIFS